MTKIQQTCSIFIAGIQLIALELVLGGTILWGIGHAVNWVFDTGWQVLSWTKCAGLWGVFLVVRGVFLVVKWALR